MPLPSLHDGTRRYVTYEFGPFRLDPVERQLWRGETELRLTGKAFDVLLALVRSGGRMIPKDEFMNLVWPGVAVEESSLTGNISILRQVLEDDPRQSTYIQTVARRGYRFVMPVAERERRLPEFGLEVSDETRTRVVIDVTTENESKPSAIAKISRVAAVAGIVAVVTGILVLAARGVKSPPVARNHPAPLRDTTPLLVPLTTFRGSEFSPALSPDGRFVAYSRTADDRRSISLHVKQTEIGSTLQLTHFSTRDGGASWSPDGKYLAFFRLAFPATESGIYVIPALGGRERRLVAAEFVEKVSWSPDGTSIAFSRREVFDGAFAIWIVSVDSGECRRLTTPPDGVHGDYAAAFSPDGRSIAFARAGENGYGGELYVFDLGQKTIRRLISEDRQIRGIAWDGDWIIYSSARSGPYSLWKISAAGGEPSAIVPPVSDAYEPAVASGPRLLAFTQLLSDANIYSIDLASPGRGETMLVGSTRGESLPRLSPDGRRIAFESDRGGVTQIWIADGDGNKPEPLTALGREAVSPAWSPDGTAIAFVSGGDVHVVPAAGGAPRRLDLGFRMTVAPSWSRDGKSIYFGANAGGVWQLWRVPVAGGAPVQVTKDGGYESAESPDGTWLYYNKRGYSRFGIFRRPVPDGKEEMVFRLPQLNSFGDWQVVSDGIYFIHRADHLVKPVKPSIRFFDFATRRVREVAELPADPGSDPGLSVSADRRRFIYSRIASISHDVMLLKNFR